MGQANNNPRSPQFRGPLPPFALEAEAQYRMIATPEWMDANKEALAGPTPPKPMAEDCNIQVAVLLRLVYPSALVGPDHWKWGAVAVGEVLVPFVKVKDAVDAAIAAREQAPAVIAPSEVPTG